MISPDPKRVRCFDCAHLFAKLVVHDRETAGIIIVVSCGEIDRNSKLIQGLGKTTLALDLIVIGLTQEALRFLIQDLSAEKIRIAGFPPSCLGHSDSLGDAANPAENPLEVFDGLRAVVVINGAQSWGI